MDEGERGEEWVIPIAGAQHSWGELEKEGKYFLLNQVYSLTHPFCSFTILDKLIIQVTEMSEK